MLHGGGQHRICSGGRAKAAAIYPFVLCKAILQGLKNQMRVDKRMRPGAHGLHNPGDDAEIMLLAMLVQEDNKLMALSSGKDHQGVKAEQFTDGITGQPLNAELVREAGRQ